jgi:hypothetical protein
LASIGVEVSPGVKIDVMQQRRDTLYFVIPPLAAGQEARRAPVTLEI